MTNSNRRQILWILDQIAAKLSRPDCDVLWSRNGNQAGALADLQDHIGRLKKFDFSRLEELELLFAPTGSLQEVSLSSGWGDEFLILATQFDKAIQANGQNDNDCRAKPNPPGRGRLWFG